MLFGCSSLPIHFNYTEKPDIRRKEEKTEFSFLRWTIPLSVLSCVQLCLLLRIFLYICFLIRNFGRKTNGKTETEANESQKTSESSLCDVCLRGKLWGNKKVRETVWARKSKVWRKPGKGHRQQDIDESESGVSGPSGHFLRTWRTFPAMNNDCRERSHSCLQPAPIYLIKITAECKRAVLLIFITGKFKGEETHFWQSSE